jgi:hypothetical protein
MAQQVEDLVLWFKLDGNSNDSSDTATNGTWTGTEQYGTGKQFAQAADFNGVSKVTSAASLSVQSVAFWMNLDVNNTDLIDLTGSAKISINGSDEITTTGLTNATIYVDNVETITAATGSYKWVTITFDSITANSIAIGDGANGRMGDVRFYTRSLSAQERISVFNNSTGNKFNDFTRVLFEIDGDLDNNTSVNSEIDLNTDDEIDSTVFTTLAPYPVNVGDGLNYFDFNNSLLISGLVRDIDNGPTTKELTVYNWEILLKDKIINP